MLIFSVWKNRLFLCFLLGKKQNIYQFFQPIAISFPKRIANIFLHSPYGISFKCSCSYPFLLRKHFILGYSTSPTARTDDKGVQPGKNYYSGAREKVKVETINELNGEDQFQFDSILNITSLFSCTCV